MNLRISVPEIGIKDRGKELHPMDIVWCNCLSLPLIVASGAEVLIYEAVH